MFSIWEQPNETCSKEKKSTNLRIRRLWKNVQWITPRAEPPSPNGLRGKDKQTNGYTQRFKTKKCKNQNSQTMTCYHSPTTTINQNLQTFSKSSSLHFISQRTLHSLSNCTSIFVFPRVSARIFCYSFS